MLNILSLGAGVQSSTMALMAAHGELTPRVTAAVFADTQAEPLHVYEWLDWLESVVSNPLLVDYPFPIYRVSAGNLREDVLNNYGTSRLGNPPFFAGGGMLRRTCTREYKLGPIYKKIRALAGLKPGERSKTQRAESWVGISKDEAMRMKPSPFVWCVNRWPLIEKDMHRHDCLKWMADRGYPEPKKSACTFCPYHNDRSWREMKMDDPTSFADAVLIDKAIRNPGGKIKGEAYIHRSLKPLDEVDFRNLEDKGQLNMFNNECEGMCGV